MQAHYRKVKTGKDTSRFNEINREICRMAVSMRLYNCNSGSKNNTGHPLNTVKGVKPFQMVQLTIP